MHNIFKEFSFLKVDKKFKYLWISQILSQLTLNMMTFILLIHLYAKTGSAIATSFIWVSYAIPALLFGPIGAAFSDIFDRRDILLVTNFLQSFFVFIFALIYQKYLFLTYGVVLIYSLLNQFYVPAEAASLPSLVSKKNLANANALFFITQLSSLVLGYALAGTLNDILMFQTSILIISFLLFIAFLSVTFLPDIKKTMKTTENIEDRIVDFFKKMLEGYKFIREKKEILYPFLLLMSLEVALNILVVNLPVLAREVLKVTINYSSRLMAVPGGIGAAFAAVIIPRLLKRNVRKKQLIEFFLAILTAYLILLIFLIPIIENNNIRNLISSLVFMGAGFSFIGILIPCQTYLQEVTPEALRGRVFGNFWFLTTLVSILPVLFSATITEILGVKFFFFILAGTTFAAMILLKFYGQKIIETSNRA